MVSADSARISRRRRVAVRRLLADWLRNPRRPTKRRHLDANASHQQSRPCAVALDARCLATGCGAFLTGADSQARFRYALHGSAADARGVHWRLVDSRSYTRACRRPPSQQQLSRRMRA